MTFIPTYAQIDSPDPVNPPDLATKNYVDRAASCRYYHGGFTTPATANQQMTIPYSLRIFDDVNAFNATTYIWTCPFSGVYVVSFQCGINLAGVQMNLVALKNGATLIVSGRGPFGTTSGYYEWPLTFVDRFVAGDTVTPQMSCGAVSQASRATASENFFSVGYLHP